MSDPQSPEPVSGDITEPVAASAVRDEAPSTAAEVVRTPGQILRETREARQLSRADVAETLRFSVRQVELVEADDYEALPGATVVRGFVRSYAKLLKLDPAPLLDSLQVKVPTAVSDVRPPQYIGEAEAGSAVGRAVTNALPWSKVLAGGVLVAAVMLVGYFLHASGMFTSAAPKATASAPVTAPVVAAPTPVTQPPVPVTDEAVLPPPSALVVEFDGHSWIEVKDGLQKVVFVGEYTKGTRQVIEGQAPFQLWIGKASNVRVMFGDRVVDLKPHTREDVARLSVE